MLKSLPVIAGLLLLCACGHRQDTRTSAPLTGLVVPSSAPWLILAPGQETVRVRGLDDALELAPVPSLTTALQAQLRHVVEPHYVPSLTIACDRQQAVMRVERSEDDASASLSLGLSLHCSSNVRGTVVARQYKAQPAMAVAPDAAPARYGQALANLLTQAAQSMGGS